MSGQNFFNTLISAKSKPFVIAGPCSAESEQQVLQTANLLAKIQNVGIFRAGIWKPRSQPGSFHGIGEKALEWLKKVKQETGLLTTVEVANSRQVEMALEAGIDVLWLGARTTVNPFYVQEIASALNGVNHPVLIKNPVTPDLPLWRGAVERFLNAGNSNIGVVHRGFSLSSSAPYRNAPEWHIPIELKRHFPEIPVFCDPSHICGERNLIAKIAQTALDLGFEGWMIETHPDPDNALSDAAQQITPERLKEIIDITVVSKENSLDPFVKDKLEVLRNQIDSIDHQMLDLLSKRFDLINEIGYYKKDNNITVFQLKRWQYLLSDRLKKADQMGMETDFVKSLLEKIHEQSLSIQTRIKREGK